MYVYLLSINYVYSNLIFSHAVYENIMYSVCNGINIIKTTTANSQPHATVRAACYQHNMLITAQHRFPEYCVTSTTRAGTRAGPGTRAGCFPRYFQCPP